MSPSLRGDARSAGAPPKPRRVSPVQLTSVEARRIALAAQGFDEPRPVRAADRMAAWLGTVPRVVLETLFGRGTLAVTGRLASLARVYDLAERVIPLEQFRRRLTREEAERPLVAQAAQALGVATAADLADYWRMSVRDTRPRLVELVAAGDLRPARVEGWREEAWLHAGADLAGELGVMAAWLGLDGTAVGRRGTLARALGAAVRRRSAD